MDGAVREKTLIEEIESLELEDRVKERILKKYWAEVNEHRCRIEKMREELYRDNREDKKRLEEQDTIISVLASHIRSKELL